MWRGISLRKLAALVFAPMLTETLATLFLAWMVLRATKTMGYEAWQHMLIPMAGSLGYATSALLAGRWVTPRWAPWLMIGSILGVTAVGLAAMAIDTYPVFVASSLAMGLCFGHYYTPFQINMTHVRPFRTVAWSVGFYNVAWGSGAALGPFIGSSMRVAPLAALAVIALGLAALHTALNFLALSAPEPTHEIERTAAFASTSPQRRVALLAFLLMNTVIRGLYLTLWPQFGKEHGWEDWQIGLGQLAIFAPLPIASLLWAKLRRRLQRPWIMLASMVIGFAGFAAIPMTDKWGWALLCVTAAGLMESCVVFHAIYYMNTDPDPRSRARCVGRFEMCAGVAGILGPASLGLLAWDDGTSWRPYAFGCALLGIAIAYVAWAHPSAEAPVTVPQPITGSEPRFPRTPGSHG